MARYRGAGKARGLDTGLFTSDLPFAEINPRLKTAEKYSDAFLRKEYTRQRDIAQKRLKRLAESDVGGWVLEQHPNGFPKLKELPDRDALVYALIDVAHYLSAERSSVSGIKRVAKDTAASLSQQTGIDIQKEQLANFGRFMNSMKKQLGLKEGTYEVKYIAEVWSDLKNKGKITKKELREAVAKYLDESKGSAADDKGSAAAQNRRIANRVAHNIDKFFDQSDLSGKTVAGLRKRKKR